jgi:hypothetical protein
MITFLSCIQSPLPLIYMRTLTYLLIPCSGDLLQKLTGSQLVKKFPAFYETRSFIAAFQSARHLSLSLAKSVQSIPHPTARRSNVILFPIYTWVFQVVSFFQDSPLKPCIQLSSTPYTRMTHASVMSLFSISSPE